LKKTTSKGNDITLAPQPTVGKEEAEGTVTGHRMTAVSAIVDVEHQKMESWIQKRKRLDREAVKDWMLSVGYGHFADTFIESEVDQMSIVKQLGHDDLVQIGIVNQQDITALLAAIRKLRSFDGELDLQ